MSEHNEFRLYCKKIYDEYNELEKINNLDTTDYAIRKIILIPFMLKIKFEIETIKNEIEFEIKIVEDNKSDLLSKRSSLFTHIHQEEAHLSSVKNEIASLNNQISLINKEIDENDAKIRTLILEAKKAHEESEHWSKVFWATCWIPGVSIGIGCKAIAVEAECNAKIKQVESERTHNKNTKSKLQNQLYEAERKMIQESTASKHIIDDIHDIEQNLIKVTDRYNALVKKDTMWLYFYQDILCIMTKIDTISLSIESVRKCFRELIEIEKSIADKTK